MPNSPDLDARQQAIVDEFAMLDDWMLRYQHLIEHAKAMPPMPDDDKSEEALVRGCQSRVWVQTGMEDGHFRLAADSDAQIVRGLASLLVRAFDRLPPGDVATADLWFVREAGLSEHLSPNRANGLEAMTRRIQQEAAAHA